MTPIIILNWNGLGDTVECIESVMKYSGTDYLIYLVDNASDAGERDELKSRYKDNPLIKLRFNDKNLGFAKAHNYLWKNELSKWPFAYIALLNNDTAVHPDWLKNLLQCAEKHNADLVSSRMIDYFDRSRIDTLGHKVLTTGEIVPIGHHTPTENYDTTFEHVGPCGGACLYSAKVLKEIGFFDPYFTTGYEDAELGLRAVLLGYRSVFCSDARVYHKGGGSIRKVFDEKYAVTMQKNILYTVIKLVPLPILVVYFPVLLVKNAFIAATSFVLFRPNISRILNSAHVSFFTKGDFQKAVRARRSVRLGRRTIDWITFYKKQHSFIQFEMGRVYRYLIMRKPSAIDQYR